MKNKLLLMLILLFSLSFALVGCLDYSEDPDGYDNEPGVEAPIDGDGDDDDSTDD